MQAKSASSSFFREARLALGLTQQQVADLCEVTVSYISKIERGEKEPSPSLRKVLEMELAQKASPGVSSLSQKRTAATPPPAQIEPVAVTRRIPVVGLAAAAMYDPALSQICDLWDASDETVPCVIDREGIFAVRIQGDSMEPDLHDGDVVAVDPNTLPATGDTAIICLRTEGLVIKRWHWRNGIIRLESLNPSGKTYQWTKDEVHQQGLILWRWKVLGVLWHKF